MADTREHDENPDGAAERKVFYLRFAREPALRAASTPVQTAPTTEASALMQAVIDAAVRAYATRKAR